VLIFDGRISPNAEVNMTDLYQHFLAKSKRKKKLSNTAKLKPDIVKP